MSIEPIQRECNAGSRPDIFVLLPGMDGTGLLFEPFMRLLSVNHQAAIVSYPAETFLEYRDLADRVRSGIPDDPFVLIAESFSGPVAALVGALRPPSLKAIVFVNSFVRFPLGRTGALLGRFIPRIFFDLMIGAGLPQQVLRFNCQAPEVSGALRSAVKMVNPAVLSMRIKAALEVDASEMLKRCTARVICLVSTGDHVIGNRSLRGFVAAKPDTEVVTVPGPHLLLQCSPADAISALRKVGLL